MPLLMRLTDQDIDVACRIAASAETAVRVLKLEHDARAVEARRAHIEQAYARQHPRAQPVRTLLSQTPVAELFEDRDRAHRVAKALARQEGIGYVDALRRLADVADAAERQKRLGTAAGMVTLGAALAGAGITLDVDRVERDAQDRRRTLAAKAATPRPDGQVDEYGRVKLPAGADPDAMLADPVAPLRAFRQAREMGLAADRDAFVAEWRLYVDAGLDLVATLQLARHQDELREAEMRADAQADADARFRREQGVREAEREAQAAQQRLQRVRGKSLSSVVW